MPTVNSMAELNRALRNEINAAMNEMQTQALADMREEVGKYYDGSSPLMYKRTHHLARTPRVSSFTRSSDRVEFDAYLDTKYTYPSITYTYWDGNQTTSKSPSMSDILNLTNNGTTSSSVGKLHPTLGNSGYWEEAEKKMERSLATIIRRHFT